MKSLVPVDNLGVCERNGQAITNSLKVAEHFSKNHFHVMEAIRNCEASDNFRLSNFRLSYYKNTQGKKQPMYEMTRDGFTFIAMGFTGKKAAEFKEAYIKAFSDMESHIKLYKDTRDQFPAFTQAILSSHAEPKSYHYSNEVNMINRIVLGMDAKKFRQAHGIQDGESIRPYLNNAQLTHIHNLQTIDVGLMYAGLEYEARKTKLAEQFERIAKLKIAQ